MAAMTRRLDYFALEAMSALLVTPHIDKKLNLRAEVYGGDAIEQLAIAAYEIARAMEVEASNNP